MSLLKEIVPKLSRVAVFGNLTDQANARSLKEIGTRRSGVEMKLQYLDIKDPKGIETAFRAAGKGSADAASCVEPASSMPHRPQIAELAVKCRLPAIYSASGIGGSRRACDYGVSISDLFRRAATYVDKILKGAKPADFPSSSR